MSRYRLEAAAAVWGSFISGCQPPLAEHGVHARLSSHEIHELPHGRDRIAFFQNGFPEFSCRFPVRSSGPFKGFENILVQNFSPLVGEVKGGITLRGGKQMARRAQLAGSFEIFEIVHVSRYGGIHII